MKGGKRKKLAKVRAKTVGRSPAWLKTVQIAKPHRGAPIRGSFGAASPVVRIDPATGLPRDDDPPLTGAPDAHALA